MGTKRFEVSKEIREERSKETGIHNHRDIQMKRAGDRASLNMEVKQTMAEELMAMGLSRESIKRILRLDVIEDKGERIKDKGEMVRGSRLRAKGKSGKYKIARR